uniref:Ig-like domain-containing protein n=1 Tax=Labrus bergylta TaxID=56723 RepID=A0A3Q3E4X3_9LABR
TEGLNVILIIYKVHLVCHHIYSCLISPLLNFTLDCTFETTDTNPFLFWYRQEAGDFPKYMLRCYSNKAENAPGISEDRFKAAINGKSVPLKIQKLQLTDSAVYYCAVRPTVTGNTTTLVKNLWREDNTILHNIH